MPKKIGVKTFAIFMVFLICIPTSANAKFFKHPQQIFTVEYPDSWDVKESRFADGYAVGSEYGEGIERCSFRVDSAEVKGKNPDDLVDMALNSSAYFIGVKSGIPTASLLKEAKAITALHQPFYLAIYDYTVNYHGKEIPMRAMGATAFNTYSGYAISLGCSTLLDRFDNYSSEFSDIFASLVILP